MSETAHGPSNGLSSRAHTQLPGDDLWRAAERDDLARGKLADREGADALFRLALGQGPGALSALLALPLAADADTVLWRLCEDLRPGEVTSEVRLRALHEILVRAPHHTDSVDVDAEARCRVHLERVSLKSVGSVHDLAESARTMLSERAWR